MGTIGAKLKRERIFSCVQYIKIKSSPFLSWRNATHPYLYNESFTNKEQRYFSLDDERTS